MTPSRIAQIRQSKGLSQTQLAYILGIHTMTVSKWERGALEPDPRQVIILNALAGTKADFPSVLESAGPLKCLWLIFDKICNP
jgi:transcriptional regulator with XRE-family HTH domain